jgi:hypothetical protein
MDLVWYQDSTIKFVVLIQLTKVINGFIHANYDLDNIIRFSFLLSMQIFVLITILYFREYFRLKTMFVLMITEYSLKIIIHISLTFRASLNT